MRHLALFAASVLVATSGLAGGASAQDRIRGDFDAADANHDGRVTLQEYEAYAKSRLAAADGTLAQRFKQLSAEDQEARLRLRFEKMDHVGKGYLDRKDWNGE